MERNLDLCHRILRYVRQQCGVNKEYSGLVFSQTEVELFQVPFEEIVEHCLLLSDAGFIKATIDAHFVSINRLTWDGHDYLDWLESDDSPASPAADE